MANDHVIGKVMIVLELPDGGVPRGGTPPDVTYHRKGISEIINEIVAYGAPEEGWASDGIKKPGVEPGTLNLTYEGGA